MKPTFFIAAAVVAVLGVAAIAFAASGDDGDDPGDIITPGIETPIPVEPDGGIGTTPNESPIPVEPDGGIGNTPDESPIPVEPDGGIGNTPGNDTPIPVEPDGGIGNTPDESPIPVEPDGGIGDTPGQSPLPTGSHAEPAPIDGLDIAIAESFPPQYFLHVVAGLPSGCAQKYTHSVAQNGNVIEVEVLNALPDGNPMCTAIYGQYELNIALGSDFVSGQTYTVIVNGGDAETEFTAQ